MELAQVVVDGEREAHPRDRRLGVRAIARARPRTGRCAAPVCATRTVTGTPVDVQQPLEHAAAAAQHAVAPAAGRQAKRPARDDLDAKLDHGGAEPTPRAGRPPQLEPARCGNSQGSVIRPVSRAAPRRLPIRAVMTSGQAPARLAPRRPAHLVAHARARARRDGDGLAVRRRQRRRGHDHRVLQRHQPARRGSRPAPTATSGTRPSAAAKIGRITPLGAVTEFSTGITPGSAPARHHRGPRRQHVVRRDHGRARSGGSRPPASSPSSRSGDFLVDGGIAAGPDGRLWFVGTSTIGDGHLRPGDRAP